MKIKFSPCLLLLFLFSLHTAYAETIFLFNPEARTTRVTKVRSGLQEYLKSERIDADVDDFESSVDKFKPVLAIVASYYYNTMKDSFKWKAILSGHKRGRKTFDKLLIASLSITEPLQLRNKSLAAVSLGSASYVDFLLPRGLSVKNIRILSVSKDIDAIMALGFEQVEAAIVMEESFDKMNKINPDTVKNLHVLRKLEPVGYPKIAVFPNAENLERFAKSFEKKHYRREIKEALKFFGVTGFASE